MATPRREQACRSDEQRADTTTHRKWSGMTDLLVCLCLLTKSVVTPKPISVRVVRERNFHTEQQAHTALAPPLATSVALLFLLSPSPFGMCLCGSVGLSDLLAWVGVQPRKTTQQKNPRKRNKEFYSTLRSAGLLSCFPFLSLVGLVRRREFVRACACVGVCLCVRACCQEGLLPTADGRRSPSPYSHSIHTHCALVGDTQSTGPPLSSYPLRVNLSHSTL